MLDSSPIISFRFAYLIAIIAIIFFAISKYGIPALLLVFSLYFPFHILGNFYGLLF